MDFVTLTIGLAAGAAVGFIGQYLINKFGLKAKRQRIIDDAHKEAEVIKKNKLLEVKEKFLNKKAELEKEISQRNNKIQQAEHHLKQREVQFNQRNEDLQRRKNEVETFRENLEAQKSVLERRQEELEKLHAQEREKLEAISGLSAEEAKERLVESLKEEAKSQAASYINDIIDDAKMTANKEAKKIVIYNGNKALGQRRVEYGNIVVPYEYTDLTGYNFIGWFVEKECLTLYDFYNMPILRDTNIYAKYEIIKFEVKFYIDNICQATKIVDYNTRVIGPTNLTLPTGMHFVAWYIDPQFTKMFDFNITIIEDKELYGKYEQDEIALTFKIFQQVELRYIKYGYNLSQIQFPNLPKMVGYTQVKPYFTWEDDKGDVWKLCLDNKGDYFENENGKHLLLSDFVVTRTYQFVAVYSINIYTITLIMPDGTKEIRYVEHGGELKDLPDYKLSFGDKLVYDQDLSYVLGDMTVNVKVKNYIKIPLIIVIILVSIGIVTTVIVLIIKAIKKRDHRGKLKELIDKRW